MLKDWKFKHVCLHNTDHLKVSEICNTCANDLKNKVNNFDKDKIPVEYRSLLYALKDCFTSHAEDLCWKPKQTIKQKINGYKLKNLLYAFYKGDIGNRVIKMTCGDTQCYNPAHMKSRFEPDHISKRVRVGFSKKYVLIDELTDEQWLRY